MRKILFRGKTEDGGWLYGDLLNCRQWKKDLKDSTFITLVLAKPPESIGDNETIIKTEVIPETVGQYTGLTDKNGKKIFEGDIVLFEDESPSNYEYHDCTEMRCGAIEYGDNCFYITDRIAVEMEDLIYEGRLDAEVIGNIHDNPELLKGE